MTEPTNRNAASEREVMAEAVRRYGHPVTDIEAIEFQGVKDEVRAKIRGPRPATSPAVGSMPDNQEGIDGGHE